jgi:hypothetical protein
VSAVTDILATVFVTQGVAQTVNSYATVENAQRRLAQAQERAYYAPSVGARNSLANAEAAALQSAQKQSLLTAGIVTSAFGVIAAAVKKATDEYSAFGTEVMNIRDLTGASARESARAASLFRVAGVSDMQAMRDILKLSKDAFSSQGASAMSMLGVPANTGQTGLALFNQIADALQKYPAGIQKAEIETELFGTKGVAALQGLLRMTSEQRQAVLDLSDANDKSLATLQRFQFASALLGETIQQRIVYPIIEKLLPTILHVLDALTWLTNAFAAADRWSHGFLGVAAAIFAISIATVAAVSAFVQLAKALKLAAVWQAILDALSGNWKNLAIGAAVAAGVGLSIYGFDRWLDKSGGSSDLPANTAAIQQNTAALTQWTDNFASFNHGGIPGGLSKLDIQQLARRRALGTIG